MPPTPGRLCRIRNHCSSTAIGGTTKYASGDRESSVPTLVPSTKAGEATAVLVGSMKRGGGGVDVLVRVCVCVWRERREKRSSESLNRAQHTRTHPPGCYRSFGVRIFHVIHTHERAHRWCYVWFWDFIFLL